MADALALVAEPDTAQRQLITGTLELVGYRVLASSTPLQLDVELHSTVAFTSRSLLLVLDPSFGAECARPLATLLRGRASAGIASPQVVLIRTPKESDGFGDLGLSTSPQVLGAPFDSVELERIARRCRVANGP
jgi:hypothetical protein